MNIERMRVFGSDRAKTGERADDRDMRQIIGQSKMVRW